MTKKKGAAGAEGAAEQVADTQAQEYADVAANGFEGAGQDEGSAGEVTTENVLPQGEDGAVITDAELADGGDQTTIPGAADAEPPTSPQLPDSAASGEAAPAARRTPRPRRPKAVTGFEAITSDVPLPDAPTTIDGMLRGLTAPAMSFSTGTSGMKQAAVTRAANAVTKDTGAKFRIVPEGEAFRVFREHD